MADALLRAGYRVRALVRHNGATQERGRRPDVVPSGVEIVEGDLTRSGELARALDGCRYLVHCAALYSFAPRLRADIERVNVAGTASLLDAAYVAGVERAVVTSSSATVGPARNGHLATEADRAPEEHHSAYHRSKILQERIAGAARVETVLVLPTTPVGPRDAKPTPTGRLVVDFARGRIFARPPATGGLNLVAVEDVAAAHVAGLQRGRARERYLIGGENLSYDELWRALGEATARPVPRWMIPYGVAIALAYADEARCRLLTAAEPMVPLEGVRMSRLRMHVECAKARDELGFHPTSVRAALARAVAWYRGHGYLN
ncbi:MAG: NAD-dependent epimerase/dehydratase family protein [Candidatus Eremiobacteraeota bacterium]|nr:NAD-dependent epimerase/dehydratase family protein [Candidatus Eremiobacteraeota bacterium]